MIDEQYKKKILFIILPKKDNRFTNDSSPIKGAIALANYLSNLICVKIIFLDNSKISSPINKDIKVYKIKEATTAFKTKSGMLRAAHDPDPIQSE